MKNHRLKYRERKGVVLIISVGVLALVAMIATSFAISMQVEYRGAVNYLNSARATALAQAGIDKVIADIRGWVANSSYSTVITNIDSYPTAETALGDGYYQITIGDTGYTREEQKININALDETDSVWIKKLNDNGLSYDDIAKIIDYRDMDTSQLTYIMILTGTQSVTSNETNAKNAPYATAEEVRLVLNNDTKYNAIKNMITVYAPILKGGLIGTYFSDRYTFNKDTILDLTHFRGKVIELGAIREPATLSADGQYRPWGTFPYADGQTYGWNEAHDGEWAGGYIAEDFFVGFGLDQFGAVFTGFIYIPQNKVNQAINFYIRSENGVNFSVDGVSIIQDWSNRTTGSSELQGAQTFTCAGWHPVKIKYFAGVIPSTKCLELRWDALGSKNYVPAEYLGYYPASYYGKQYDYFNKAFYAPTSSTGTLYTDYNSAGIFKITSKGRVKRSDGTLLAEKQLTTVINIFNTWTQTTRAEFYAPWFTTFYKTQSDFDNVPKIENFSEGAIRNVTWLDSCPTDPDSWNSTTKKMHWEESYAKVKDSLKLGYWNDFDEDVAYSVVTLKGGKQSEITGTYDPVLRPDAWTTVTIKGKPYSFPILFEYAPDQTWSGVSFGETSKEGANGTYNLNIWCPARQEKYAELNGKYYAPGLPNGSSDNLGYDIFVRSYIQDNGSGCYTGNWWWNPASYRLTNPGQPTAAYTPKWMQAHLFIKRLPWGATGPDNRYFTMLKDGDADIWDGDEEELNVPGKGVNIGISSYPLDTDRNYANKKTNPYILAAVGVGTKYSAYYSYLTTASGGSPAGNFAQAQAQLSSSSTDTGVVQFNESNMHEINYNNVGSAICEKIYTRNAPWFGCQADSCSVFDDMRIIYPKGFLVSTPFVARYAAPEDNSTIKWGTVSWTADTPTATSPNVTTGVTIYIRSTDPLVSTDDFATSVSNGGSLSAFTARQIQYKALLSSTLAMATNPTVADYQNNSITPVLKDVTITYMLPLETLYRK